MQLLLAKYNLSSSDLSGIAKYQFEQLSEVEELLKDQILDLEKQLYPGNDDVQRLPWIPGIVNERF